MDYGSSSELTSDQVSQLLSGMAIVYAVVMILVFVVMLWIWGRIFHKAGYSGWLSLLFLVPLVNMFIIFWFAFAQWPVEKRAAMGAPAPYAPPGYAPQPAYQQPQAYQPAPQTYAQPQAPSYPPQQPGGYPPPPPQGGYPPQQ